MFWVQDLWPESLSAAGAVHSAKVLKIVEKLVRLIYKGSDRILVQSRAFAAPIRVQGVDPERIIYFPNAAEALYRPVTLEQSAPEKSHMPQGFRVMFAGNIGAAQDFGTILSAAEKLKDYPDIHWVVIGDGRIRRWVEAQVRERGLGKTMHLLGRHPAEAMPRYFSLADAMLVTLRRKPIFALTIPAKIQSYLACAKPVIAALDGEGASIIREAKAGLTCPAEDPQALTEAVLAMYRMSENERRDMGSRGRDYFKKHFERTLLLNRLENWMTQLCSEKA